MSAEKYIIKAGKRSEYSVEEFLKINEELIKDWQENPEINIKPDVVSIFHEAMETSTVDPENDIAKRSIVDNLAKYLKNKGCDVKELRISGWDPQIFIIFQGE